MQDYFSAGGRNFKVVRPLCSWSADDSNRRGHDKKKKKNSHKDTIYSHFEHIFTDIV